MDVRETVTEREGQIAALHEPTRKVREKHVEQALSLRQALGQENRVSREDIKALVRAEYNQPVISLYLQFDPQKVVPKEKALLRSFRSLKRKAMDERHDFIDQLSRQQKENLNFDIEEIESFLSEYFVPEGLRSLIIFKSGEELNRVIRLSLRSTDALIIDVDPYIVPLEAVLEKNERVLFVEVSKEESRFLTYDLGHLEEMDRVKSFVPTDSVDKSIPGKVQMHRLTHLQWHLKLTALHVYRLYNDRLFDALVLMGEGRVLHLLEEYLHEAVKEKIIGRINDSPDADQRDRKEVIEAIVRNHKAQRETQAVEALSNYRPGQDMVSGLPDVINVLNLFVLRKLLVAENLQEKGFVCRQHHYVSLKGGECPFCGLALLQVENVVDEITEIARLHGVELTLVEYKQDLLAKYDGIAAIVYASPAQT
ncbi:MAG: hypothetical protein JWO91_2804 [Acidobacteriaceae bacterium]|nr:hypothetical protein [Acidobacteriaceae bacterium]